MRPVISDLGIERSTQQQRFLQPFAYDEDNNNNNMKLF